MLLSLASSPSMGQAERCCREILKEPEFRVTGRKYHVWALRKFLMTGQDYF